MFFHIFSIDVSNNATSVLFSISFITFRSCAYLDRKHTVFGR